MNRIDQDQSTNATRANKSSQKVSKNAKNRILAEK